MKQTRFLSLGGLILAVLVFIGINFAAQPLLRTARLDLTENKVNTLTAGTRSILNKLEKPIELQFYLSRGALEEFPGLKTYTTRVEELLREYEAESGGKLSVEVIDPVPFSQQEDAAVKVGLQGVPAGNSAGSFYFGLTGTDGSRSEILPFFQPEREQLLEYDISHLIYKLANPKKIRVGLMNTLRMQGGMNRSNPQAGLARPWAITGLLKRTFDLRLLDSTLPEIPSNIDVLMLVQPKLLSEPTLYAIDQFVLRGGRVVAFVDPLSEVAAARNQGEVFLKTEGMRKMLQGWGVDLAHNKVVADLGAAQQVSISRTVKTELIDYVPWHNVQKKQMAQDDVATAQLNSLQLATAGTLSPVEGASTTFKPLIRSTDQAMLIEAGELAYTPDPRRMLANFKPTGEQYVMAARVTGPTTSAFPDGPPLDEEGQPTQPLVSHLAKSNGDINLVVVADSDMLYDRFWVQVSGFFGQQVVKPISNNADMATNAIEQMGGSEDLISIRSRGTYARPFELMEDLRSKAELQFRAKEQELLTQLRTTDEQMKKLQEQRQRGGLSKLTPEQEQQLIDSRQKQLELRKELRQVQFELRRDIEQLQNRLKVINIGLMPGLIAIAAIILVVYRRRQDRRYRG